MHLAFFLLAVLLPICNARKNEYIVPGAQWLDTSGNVITAHAGGMTYFNSTWYWFGQDERAEDTRLFSGLNVYSSSDLLNWDFRERALEPVAGTDIDGSRVVERPKSIFNEQTGLWTLWFHSDNSSYGLLQQGYATSPNITGPYTFQKVISPLGGTSQDFGLFKDDDGKAYALYSNGDADFAHDNIIARLNANYTDVEEVVYTFFDFDLEAPNIVKTDGRYYILMSHKTGYRPNNVEVFSAENIAGPWSVQSYIAPLGTKTFNSQSTMSITLNGSSSKTYIYCGDQWATGSDLYDSTYIWLPATVDDATGSFAVTWHDLYSVDIASGEVSFPEGTVYEAEGGVVGEGAYSTLCPTCSGHGIVTNITGPASLTIANITGTGAPQWLSLHYHNPDGLWGDNRAGSGQTFKLWRTAAVSVNGGTPQTVRQRSGSSGVVLSTPVNVTLNEGGGNEVKIWGLNGTMAADLDKIVVYGNIYADDDE